LDKLILPTLIIFGVAGAYLLGLASGSRNQVQAEDGPQAPTVAAPVASTVAPQPAPAVTAPAEASPVTPAGQGPVSKHAPISGIGCDAMEGEALHIHAQLQIYFNGKNVPLPAGLGIADSCTYWLHTHTADGVIHVEAPVDRNFTLGQFIDVAGMPRFGPGTKVRAFVDVQDGSGFHEFHGNYRDILLTPHAVIALGVGDFTPQPFTFEADL
jgi:hypothetical protein